MKIAYYAPMKPPGHPVPSGDRSMARLLWTALRRAGHDPLLISRLRSYEGRGDPRQQRIIERRAARVRRRLLDRFLAPGCVDRPALWFTYHLYHKAPDLLGPAICRALEIPYVVAEASHAPKQAGGPWTGGFESAREALLMASRIIALNPVDVACVDRLLATGQGRAPGVSRLAPFIDARRMRRWSRQAAACRQLVRDLNLKPGIPVLITVAMMRNQAKLASYALLARALKELERRPWQLIIAGDGEARGEVESRFRGFAPGRVRFVGRLAGRSLAHHLGLADLFVWPAIDEAWGMVFMEAAAAGLPCVAGAAGGVAQVVAHGSSGLLVPKADAGAFAAALAELLADPQRRCLLAAGAVRKVLTGHDLEPAAARLQAILKGLERVKPHD